MRSVCYSSDGKGRGSQGLTRSHCTTNLTQEVYRERRIQEGGGLCSARGNRKLSRRQDFVKDFLGGGVLQGVLALDGLCDLIFGQAQELVGLYVA